MKSNKKEVEKKAKEKKFSKITVNQDKILRIIIIVLIVVIVFLVLFRLFDGKYLATDNKLVKELHNYLMPEDLNDCEGLSNYADKKVTINDLDDKTKLCLAYQKTDLQNIKAEEYNKEKKSETCKIDNMIFGVEEEVEKCMVSQIKKDIIEKTYKKLFGENIKTSDAFNYNNNHICYLKDDTYYCGKSETYTYVIDGESSIYRIIEKVKEKGSIITIYDYFLKIKNDNCYKYYTTLDKNENCPKNFNKNTKIDYKFMKKYGTLYKHVYQKDANDEYHWVSSTPI